MRTLADISVGSLVYLRVDGSYTPFRVMQHGRPDSTYDTSYQGGVILCLDYTAGPYETQVVEDEDDDNAKVVYTQSYLHKTLNEGFLSKLDSAMQAQIIEVKLPCRSDTDSSPYEVATGSSGYAAKVWLPSLSEVTDIAEYDGAYGSPYVTEGAMFDYWVDADSDQYSLWLCKDKYGTSIGWGTRTPSLYHGDTTAAAHFFRVSGIGLGYFIVENDVSVWPHLVMPSTLPVDGDNHLHILGSVPVKTGGVWNEGSSWSRQAGVWSETEAIAVKVDGVWKEGGGNTDG